MNKPLWMYLAWLLAALCVTAMALEASRVTVMPSTRPGCLWLCDVQADAFTARADHQLRGLSWVVVGGESGPGHATMNLTHVDALVAQADAAKVPVFVKQDSGPRPGMRGRLSDELWSRKGFPQ